MAISSENAYDIVNNLEDAIDKTIAQMNKIEEEFTKRHRGDYNFCWTSDYEKYYLPLEELYLNLVNIQNGKFHIDTTRFPSEYR